MCKNCKASELGRQRQAAYDTARSAVEWAGLTPAISGFLAAYGARSDQGGRPRTPLYSAEQQRLLDAYTRTRNALEQLHNDYIFGEMRREVERARVARAAEETDR
jgi:hypothetical protein